MSSQKGFAGRVKFTLRELGEDAENYDVYEKMIELFRVKQKTGSLRDWLLDLAYQEAARELLISQGQVGRFKGAVVSSRESVQEAPNPPIKQQARKPEPEPEQRLEAVDVEPQAQAVRQSVAESIKPSVGRTVSEKSESMTLGGVVEDGDEIFDDEDTDYDMESFLPITLAQRAEEEKKKQGKGSSLPLGISSLVMST